MRIAVFSTKPYDRQFLDAANVGAKHEFVYLESRLTLQTAAAAEGAGAVCAFVNNELSRGVLDVLSRRGMRLAALRSAGLQQC